MTPERLAKIKAMAADTRGDPKTRQIAIDLLKKLELKPEEEPWTPPPNKQNPGMRASDDYERFLFMRLDNWGRTRSDNPIITVQRHGTNYIVVLFKHKQTPTHGWRISKANSDEQPMFSRIRYRDQDLAMRAAWEALRNL